jgi:glycerol kinase
MVHDGAFHDILNDTVHGAAARDIADFVLAHMNVLAIDQGTSSTKALVVGPDGAVLGEGRADVSPRASAGGAVEQDPQELLDSVVAAGRAALDAAGEPVAALGLGNQGETVLRWDRASGRPLGPAISWQDRRAVDVTRELAGHEERLVELSGLPLDPYFAAPKMTWLRRSAGPEGVITTVDAWITHQLTGAFVTDAATASRTMLLDLERTAWSDEACELFGLDPDEQPAVVGCDAVVGQTGAFGGSLPVSGLAVDQQAALFAQSCFEPGDAKCTYGTGAFILANAGTEVPSSASRLAACVAWSVDARTAYCLDGQIYTAGSAVSWLRELGLLEDASRIDAICGGAAPAADAPVFVPALAGLGTPYWAPQARGAWVGLSLATRSDDLVRAVVWGIAAQVATLGAAIGRDVGRPLGRLRVDGGFAQSAALMQAQSDLLQVPVERYPSPDATALGVGAFARLGAGDAGSPSEAVGEWTPSAVFEPSIPAAEAAERLARFDAAAKATVALGGAAA